MDLSKGLDERSRPEVGGEQSKLITTLENLIQEETGSWVKRPGVTSLSSNLSAAGILRLIRTQNGLAACATDARLYDLPNQVGSFISKGYIPEFRLEARMVGTTHTNTTYRVIASASNNDYDVVVTEGSYRPVSVIRTMPMIWTERATGQQVANIDIAGAFITGSNTITPQVKIVFVGDDLHVWVWDGNTAGGVIVWGIVGINGVTSGPTAVDAGITTPISDINAYTGGSVITYGTRARTMNSFGTPDARAIAGHTYHSVEVVLGNFYLLSSDSATGRARVDEIPVSAGINGAATGSTVDAAVTFPANTTPGIAMDGVSGNFFVSYEDTATFPMVITYTFPVGGAMTLSSTIYGWRLLSTPFRGGLSSRVYVHLCKDETGMTVQNPVGCHVLVNLSESFAVNHSATANQLTNILPVAAVLDPYLAVRNTQRATYAPGSPTASTTWQRNRYFQQSTAFPGNFNVTIAVQVTARTAGFMSITCSDDHPAAYTSHSFGPTTIIAGGATTYYDGKFPAEAGFFDYPMFTVVDSGVAGNPNGIYNYLALFKKVDASGTAHYSRAFGPVSLTVASKKITTTVQACHVTNSESGRSGDSQVIVELYRTLAGGTQYFLCSTSNVPSSSTQDLVKGVSFYTCTDDMSDATLATKPLLFRQPGTAGTELDRYPGPSGNVSCQHKDRSFVTDTLGTRVYYSNYFVDGEGVWFSPLFSLQAHGGCGPITGLVSMDGRLFIFKRDAIFVVDGDGPPANGGNGMEFSPPTRVATEYGCVDHRSIVMTPDGVMYRSQRGIEILTRSLQVKWIGERVHRTVDENVHTKSAIMDTSGRVRFMLAEFDGLTNGVEAASACDGVEVIYDTTSDSWSTSKYWIGGTYGKVPNTSCIYDIREGTHMAPVRSVVHGDDVQSYRFRTDGGTRDSGGHVPWTMETGWIRPAGNQGRHRLHDVMFLGKNLGTHKLKMSLAFDYEGYDQSRTWDYTSIGVKSLEELSIQPKAGFTQPVTFRLKVQNLEADGGVFDDDGSVDLLGVSFVVSQKAGPQQLAEYRKG